MLILFLPLLAAGGAGLNLVKCLRARGHGDQGIYNFTQCPGSSGRCSHQSVGRH